VAHYARPALGLVVPVGLAIVWEIVVWLGLSNGGWCRADQNLRHHHGTGTKRRAVAPYHGDADPGGAGSHRCGCRHAARRHLRLLDLARAALGSDCAGAARIPSLAWVPLFILWLGIFESSKVALIGPACSSVYLGVMGAILSVDRKIVEVGRSFVCRTGDDPPILLPAVLPAYVIALRVGLGLGWMFVVAAELMGASEG